MVGGDQEYKGEERTTSPNEVPTWYVKWWARKLLSKKKGGGLKWMRALGRKEKRESLLGKRA